MHTIEYWHELAAEWRPAGQLPRATLALARQRVRELTVECDYLFAFRIISLTDE